MKNQNLLKYNNITKLNDSAINTRGYIILKVFANYSLNYYKIEGN